MKSTVVAFIFPWWLSGKEHKIFKGTSLLIISVTGFKEHYFLKQILI